MLDAEASREEADLNALPELLGNVQRHLRRLVQHTLHDQLGEFDFKPIDGVALMTIGRRPGISITELAAALGLSQTSVSSMIKRYERLGHVERRVDERDRRVIQLHIAPGARELMESRVRPALESVFLRAVSGLSEAEKLQLLVALRPLVKNLQEMK